MTSRQMKCEKCQEEFLCSPVDIKTTNIKIKNQDLLLQCFVCPNCDALYPIFLIRFKDMHLFKDVQSSLSAYRDSFRMRRGLGLDKKLELINMAEKKYKSNRQKLCSVIEETKKKFSGHFTYDKQTRVIYYHEKNMEEKEK